MLRMHSHDTGRTASDELTTSTAVRRALGWVLVPLLLATLAGVVLLWPGSTDGVVPDGYASERARGTVTQIDECLQETTTECTAQVELGSGPGSPGTVTALMPFGEQAPVVEVGDRVVLAYLADVPAGQQYQFFDYDRSTTLLVLVLVFVLAVLALTRWRGIASLFALGISVLVIVQFVLPAVLDGKPPIAVAVVGASVIMIATLYLTHGPTVRTSVALLGTLASLVLTALLGAGFIAFSDFTGIGNEYSLFLGDLVGGIDYQGLLLAGLVIGALGVLDDVTVTQAAVVWELALADPQASRSRLFTGAMRVGRAHVQATVNTLVLAYVGATLPLLLIFSVTDVGLVDAVTTEVVAQEIVRALVGSIGIVAAVPLTTAIAALVVRRRQAATTPTTSTLPG